MRCAILMPMKWRGGMLNFAILLCNMLADTVIENEPTVVSFCVPRGYNVNDIIGLSPAVNVVAFDHMPWSSNEFGFKTFVSGDPYKSSSEQPMTYPAAADGAMDIVISDVWILMTGLFFYGPIMPLKPYIVYAPDFIQRIVPQIYGADPVGPNWIMNGWQSITMQKSQGVFVTSRQTGRDAVSYAGITSEKIQIFPMANAPLFSISTDRKEFIKNKYEKVRRFFSSSNSQLSPELTQNNTAEHSSTELQDAEVDNLLLSERPYFLWVTNATQHKNHIRALDALERYYSRAERRFACIICGPTSELFFNSSEIEYIDKVYNRIKKCDSLNKNVFGVGEVSAERYKTLLEGAAFLWHNVIYDNGTFSVIEAARLGTRSLAAGYPQMIEIIDSFKINAETFDPWSVDDAAAALESMEGVIMDRGVEGSGHFDYENENIFKHKLIEMLRGALNEAAPIHASGV